jgi:hypothetical protein
MLAASIPDVGTLSRVAELRIELFAPSVIGQFSAHQDIPPILGGERLSFTNAREVTPAVQHDRRLDAFGIVSLSYQPGDFLSASRVWKVHPNAP